MGSFTPEILIKTLLSILIVLPVLIAVHELGHFWFARIFGMKVDAFAVMVGGIRKTNLDHLLKKPLIDSRILWMIGSGLTLLAAYFGFAGNNILLMAVLPILGILLPIWICTRIGALYHLQLGSSLGTLGKTWAVSIVLSLLGTRGQGMNATQLLGLITLASVVGILINYYQPVLHKAEDSPQGMGQIELPGRNEGELHPVQFRPLASRTDKHGTEFSLLCWPLGGFASIRGMHPKEDGSETKIDGGFYSKSPFARLMVLFAGPLFSVLLGIVILTANISVSGEKKLTNRPIISELTKDGPGDKAGLKPGDKFVTVNEKVVSTWFDVVKEVRVSIDSKKEPIPVRLTIDRDGKLFDTTIVPVVDKVPTPVMSSDLKATEELKIQAKLLALGEVGTYPVSIGDAFATAVQQPVKMVTGLISLAAKPKEIANNIGGPASIAQGFAVATQNGTAEIINLAGMLSISLGVMNLLPIGPLDGGQMMVAFAELLRGGKRLSYRIQMTVSTIGAMLVMVLILFVVTVDIGNVTKR